MKDNAIENQSAIMGCSPRLVRCHVCNGEGELEGYGGEPRSVTIKHINMKEEYWITKNGEAIAVGDMDEDHVRNCLRMLIRRQEEDNDDAYNQCDATEADIY